MHIRLISLPTIGRNRLILITAILFMSIALAVMAVAVTGARARRIKSAPPAMRNPATVQGQSTPERIEMERIILTPRGFEPSAITRPRGAFYIAVDNRSGLQDQLTFLLDRMDGNRLHEARLPKGRLGWRQLVDLPPGRYALTEADHPDWVCSVTITAQ
jgi:hypothetical protein